MRKAQVVIPLMAVCLASVVSATSGWRSYVAQSSGQRAQSASGPSESDPANLLERARTAMGFDAARGRVLHVRAATAVEQPYQSDRTYLPFFSMIGVQEIWFDVETGVQRVQEETTFFPGSGPIPPRITLDDGVHAARIQGDKRIPVHRRQAESRNLDPWAVISDWSRASDVRAGGVESYRDYPRIALVRATAEGDERLLIDPKTGYPIKLDLVEPHYLWGQRHIEYVWSTWVAKDGLSYPGAAFRLADGAVEHSRTNGDVELLAPAAAPTLTRLAPPATAPHALPVFLQPLPPSTVKVTDTIWVLSNPGYNEVAAEVGGEVFLFDSTQGEERARLDAALIRKLFPGTRKINVVVTDLAWPHIAGVRYWVAQGATIVAHRAAQAFLQRVVERKWTIAPDLLEQKRTLDPGAGQFSFVPIDRATTLAGGGVRLVPIDGIASEVALMAYLPRDRFLWASDFIQTLDSPSQYAREVIAAVRREGIEPERVAAEHLAVTPWDDVLEAQVSPASR